MKEVVSERVNRLEEIILDMVSNKLWKRLSHENKEAIRVAIEVDDMNDAQQTAYDKAIKELTEEIRNISEYLLELINENIGLDVYASQLYDEFYTDVFTAD